MGVCCFATIINLANHFTKTFILCTFVKFTREKNTKTKSKNLILELFIFSLISVVTNAFPSRSFYLLQNWIKVTKLMESIDYFPSGQMYQNMEHLNYKCETPIYACTQRIDLI